ncbi:exonuclease domain-containing protein [Schaalia sp. ZJ1691]|uniref:exonuclease domain-containing protein n=1 Tax=Schaalia sp. ZJ1691 TaxID=2709404 RepID=UPI0013EC5149|nr:exonuclease domain-containing protein [Schaalia sp. ZJ1691]
MTFHASAVPSRADSACSPDTRASGAARVPTFPKPVFPEGFQPGFPGIGTNSQAGQWVILDIETTGLGIDCAITEIGAVHVVGAQEQDSFHSLVNPGVAIPAVITRLTGITDATVASAPPIEDVLPAFVTWLSSLINEDEPASSSPLTLVAHNAPFDMGFLTRAARQVGVDWPTLPVVDTLALARTFLPRPTVTNHRLVTLAAFFATTADPEHRALGDARVTAQILDALVDIAGEAGVTAMEDLALLSTLSTAEQRRMRAQR